MYKMLNKNGFKIVHKSNIITSKNIDDIYLSYQNDFPLCEQKKYLKLVEMLETNKYKLYEYNQDGIKAYLLGYKEDHILWMDYLAVLKEFRGQKIGTKFLESMLEYDIDGILFEVEISDGIKGSESYNREQFYFKLGAIKLNINYELPTADGSLRMNLFLLKKNKISDKRLANITRNAISFIHSDFKHTQEVLDKYIKDFKNCQK